MIVSSSYLHMFYIFFYCKIVRFKFYLYQNVVVICEFVSFDEYILIINFDERATIYRKFFYHCINSSVCKTMLILCTC